MLSLVRTFLQNLIGASFALKKVMEFKSVSQNIHAGSVMVGTIYLFVRSNLIDLLRQQTILLLVRKKYHITNVVALKPSFEPEPTIITPRWWDIYANC